MASTTLPTLVHYGRVYVHTNHNPSGTPSPWAPTFWYVPTERTKPISNSTKAITISSTISFYEIDSRFISMNKYIKIFFDEISNKSVLTWILSSPNLNFILRRCMHRVIRISFDISLSHDNLQYINELIDINQILKCVTEQKLRSFVVSGKKKEL